MSVLSFWSRFIRMFSSLSRLDFSASSSSLEKGASNSARALSSCRWASHRSSFAPAKRSGSFSRALSILVTSFYQRLQTMSLFVLMQFCAFYSTLPKARAMYSYSVVTIRRNEAFGEEKSAQVFTLERFDLISCAVYVSPINGNLKPIQS